MVHLWDVAMMILCGYDKHHSITTASTDTIGTTLEIFLALFYPDDVSSDGKKDTYFLASTKTKIGKREVT